MSRTLLNMLAITVDEFPWNWTQQLPYVMMAFRTSIHESTKYTPQFFVFGEEINLPIDNQYPSQEHPTRLTCISLSRKRVDKQQDHEAARLRLQPAQLWGIALYNSKTHGLRYKPDYSVCLPISFAPKETSPKLWFCGKVHSQLYSVLTMLLIKSRTQRTKRRPSFTMTA